MTRVSVDDLLFAAEWLDHYEAQDDDSNGPVAQRMSAWLREEVERRNQSMVKRAATKLAKEHNIDPKVALKKLQEKLNQNISS